MSAALGSIRDVPSRVALRFRGNAVASGVNCIRLSVDAVPEGRLSVRIHVEERGMKGGDPSVRAAVLERGLLDGRRARELDPVDDEMVGELVDDIEAVRSALRVPGDATWLVSGPFRADAASGELPKDEPWLEDAGDDDLLARLVRLAGMRGGRILVRFTGPSAVIALTTRRWRGRVHVDATSLGVEGIADPPWASRWTFPQGALSAGEIVETLRGVLRRLSPPGSGDRLALRLEQHDAAKAAADASAAEAYVLLFAAVLSVLIFGLIALVMATPTATGLLGFYDGVLSNTGVGSDAWQSVVFGALVISWVLWYAAVLLAGWAIESVDAVARRLGWRYSAANALESVVAFAGSLAFLALAFGVGESWPFVVAAPLVLGAVMLAWSVGRRLGAGE